MSCNNLPKHPFGFWSPYHLLHINSCRYSIRKSGFVLPFINLNFSFAVHQLLSACCEWTPVTGSTKCREWFPYPCCKPSLLCSCRYAAHWSVCTIEPSWTFRRIMARSVAALRRLTSCKYGLAGVYCVSNSPEHPSFSSSAASSIKLRKKKGFVGSLFRFGHGNFT